MERGENKVMNILKGQMKNYLQVPICQKILPLIGISFYLFFVPLILHQIIPLEFTPNQYLSEETQKTAVYIVCLYLANFLTLVGYSIFIFFVYTKRINLQKYRVNPENPWPWEQNYQKWQITLIKTIKTVLINTSFFGVLSLILWACFLPRKVIVSAQIPSYQTIIWQFFVFMIIQDWTSTLTHTLLHSPQLYWIHKKHHEYTTTVSIAAEYAHPIEFIISNSFPTIIGFKILAYFYPVHIITALTWLIYRVLLTSDLHSGYEFPWDFYKLLPFTAPASYHDYHHSHNVGNYASSFMIIQAILGHNTQYYKYIQSKKISQKDSKNK